MSPTTERAARFVARWWLQAAMVLALAAVYAVAVWTAAVERSATLDDFSHEHASLALMVAVDVEHRMVDRRRQLGTDQEMPDDMVHELLSGARKLESHGELLVLVSRPGQRGFLSQDRRLIPSTSLRVALDRGETTVTLPGEEAATFGLPRRMAIGGLARIEGPGGAWGIVVLGSAERIRNRQEQEGLRLGSTILVVSALVAAFSGLARRRQRRQLELERQVAVNRLEREREALLAKADKMATVAALSTGIAHELGTPLGVIVGRVEQTLDRVGEDPRATKALHIVLEQVQRIQAIVRGCLALARGDAPCLSETSPVTVATHALDLVRHRFEMAGVHLSWRFDEDLPSIACEASLFEQALVNVLLNACQATPAGGRVRLRISARHERVRFRVDDEGRGIEANVAELATAPFFSTKREEGGSGLGLTIAREIVDHHAGKLTLTRRSESGGTRAVIEIASISTG